MYSYIRMVDNEWSLKAEGLMKELLIGAGVSRVKRLMVQGTGDTFHDLTTLDMNPEVNPDVVHDLNQLPLPFGDGAFDEIHAYEVLEHLGQQGDFRSFFALFEEFYRILKPGGLVLATVPAYNSQWAWGDPGHTRIITAGTLVFLSQDEYKKQVGNTSITDYRVCYKGDFVPLYAESNGDTFAFVLKRNDPSD
jgi:SAM-dependent methyltransferase